jgi:hypothetical protein
MLTYALPLVASSAAIPTQVLTLTLNPMWSAALFATALVLTCGALWLLKNVELASRRSPRDERNRALAFPRPVRPAVAGAHRGA